MEKLFDTVTADEDLSYQASLNHMIGILKDANPKIDYVSRMKAFVKKINKTGAKNPEGKNWTPDTKQRAVRNLVQDFVAACWTSLSDIHHDCMNDGDKGVDLKTFAEVTDDRGIEFIKTFARPVDKGRRQAADGFIDGYVLPVKKTESSAAVLKSSYLPKMAAPDMGGAKEEDVMAVDPIDPDASSGPTDMDTDAVKDRVADTNRKRKLDGVASTEPEPPPKEGKRDTDKPVAMAMMASDVTLQATVMPQPPPVRIGPVYLVPDFLNSTWNVAATERFPISSQLGDPTSPSLAGFVAMLDTPALAITPEDKLLEGDGFRSWLLAATNSSDIPGSSVSVVWDSSQSPATVQHMALDLPATANRPRIQYSSLNTSLLGNFADRSGAVVTLPSTGFFTGQGFIAFGLTADSRGPNSTPWKLTQVLREVNILASLTGVKKADAVFAGLVQALDLDNKVNFTLERGVIWFAPLENYLVIHRLEWGLDAAAENSLRAWCRSWMGDHLTIRSPKIVSRRECRRVISSDVWTAVHEHDLMILFQIAKDGRNDVVITCGLDLHLSKGAQTLTATVRVDGEKAGFLDLLEWLIPSAGGAFADGAKAIPVLDNILLRSVQMKLSKAGTSVSIDKVIVTAEYSDDKWKVDRTTVPLLVSSPAHTDLILEQAFNDLRLDS